MERFAGRRAWSLAVGILAMFTAPLVPETWAQASSTASEGDASAMSTPGGLRCDESDLSTVDLVGAAPTPESRRRLIARYTGRGCHQFRPGEFGGNFIRFGEKPPGASGTTRMNTTLVAIASDGQRDTLASLTTKNGKGLTMTGFPGYDLGGGVALELDLNAKPADDLTDDTYYAVSYSADETWRVRGSEIAAAGRDSGDLLFQLVPQIEFAGGVSKGSVVVGSLEFAEGPVIELNGLEVDVPFGSLIQSSAVRRLKTPRKVQFVLEQLRDEKRVMRHKLTIKVDAFGQLTQRAKKLKKSEIRQGDIVELSVNPKGRNFAPGDVMTFLYNLQER